MENIIVGDFKTTGEKRINIDLVEFEGKEIKCRRIEELLAERKRHAKLDEIVNNPDVKFCYIVKRGIFYRPNSCDYTQYQYKAGVYTKEEAVKGAKLCNELWIRPINIEEHNKRINEEINLLQKCLIPIV